MKRILLITAVLLGAVSVSEAGVRFGVGIGVPLPGVAICPRAVVVAPPAVCAPPPATVVAPSVIVVPGPVYYGCARGWYGYPGWYGYRGWHGYRGWGPRGGWHHR